MTASVVFLAGCGVDHGPSNYHLASTAYSPEHRALFVATPTSGTIDVLRVQPEAADGGLRFVARLSDPRRKHVLRLFVDSPRDRLWAVGPEAAYLYELRGLSLQQVFGMPGTTHYDRLADLVLDQAGNAYVLARGGARIFRIDAVTLRFDLWLDVGSSARDGAVYLANRALISDDDKYLLVVSPDTGGLLRIDTSSKRVEPVALAEPIDLTCGLLFWSGNHQSKIDGLSRPTRPIVALDCNNGWQAQIHLTGDAVGIARTSGRANQINKNRAPSKITFQPG